MTYLLLIWFSIGFAPVEHFQTSDQCFKRLDSLVEAYRKTYVVRSSGCFPRELVIAAAKGAAQ
jgi:hypothetical protein